MKAFLQKPTADELLFAFKCLLAAIMALYIALRIGLPRPFWAPMATCIISQSMSGSVFVRASSRLIGTLVGTVVAVLLLISFINYTFLLCFLIALWVGTCMYFSMLKRTTDAYVFTVAGFTVPVIIYGIIGDIELINVQDVTDMAIARAEETGIGFFSAIVVHSLFFPRSIGPVVVRRMDEVWKSIRQWTASVLQGHATANDSPRTNATRIITDLRVLSANLPFDASNERWAVANIRLLQDRLTVMNPVISSIEDSISPLQKAGK
ncbi:MAG: FUSC family protein, partial [Oxalobacter sp.]|nr:FUSC family protein [Oxalobacter sp.]